MDPFRIIELNELWKKWIRQYPIISLEDGMGEKDWNGWQLHTPPGMIKIFISDNDKDIIAV